MGTIGKVIKIDEFVAEVEINGVIREVSISFVPEIKVGDYCIVHAGFILRKVGKEEVIKGGEIYHDEQHEREICPDKG
jgi:hydrogenase assembly chaperone HypC/HupF